MTLWESRIKGPVLQAMLDGLVLFAGKGELHPIGAIHKVLSRKGDLKVSPSSGFQAPDASRRMSELKFLQSVSGIPSIERSDFHRFGDYIENSIGHLITVTLGEVSEVPRVEWELAAGMIYSVIFKPVRIIAVIKWRHPDTNYGGPFPEHLLLEIYSEDGEHLLWKHPGISLESRVEMSNHDKLNCNLRGERLSTESGLEEYPTSEIAVSDDRCLSFIDLLEASHDEILESNTPTNNYSYL